jgi:hypothetical protein
LFPGGAGAARHNYSLDDKITVTKRDAPHLLLAGIIILVGFGGVFSIRFLFREETKQFFNSLLGDNLLVIALVGLGISGLGFVAFLKAGRKDGESGFSLNTIRAAFFGLVFVFMLFALIVASVI